MIFIHEYTHTSPRFAYFPQNCPHAELQLYAQLHAMLLSIQQGDMERVAAVLPAVETACAGSKLIGMRAAMYLVEALKSLQEQEYHKTK